MTPRKKITLLQIGSYAGAIVVSLSLVSMTWGFILSKFDERIDTRIENKTAYMLVLLRNIATPEQLKKADEEYKRFGK